MVSPIVTSIFQQIFYSIWIAHSAGAVEYTDCTSA